MNDVVVVNEELEQLAVAINEEHQNCVQTFRQGLGFAMLVGEHLVKAKQLVKHGQWKKWVKANCEFTPRMARTYMQVARYHAEMAETEITSDMTIQKFLKLAEPKRYYEVEVTAGDIRHYKEQKKQRWKLENEHNQVKDFLDAEKEFRGAVVGAVEVAKFGKFSPEGKRFTIRRIEHLIGELEKLVEVLRE